MDEKESELADRVSTALKAAYPLDSSPVPHLSRVQARRPRTMKWVTVTAMTLTAVGGLAVGLTRASHGHGATPTAEDTHGHVDATPKWTKGCFHNWAPPRPQDSAYKGLPISEASALAARRNEQLVFVGGDGKCVKIGSQVRYSAPVAIFTDKGSLESDVSREAVVVFANSNPKAEFDGWIIR